MTELLPAKPLQALKAAGLTDPRGELRALVRLAASTDQDLGSLVARRVRREPFAYIAECKEFWSLSFAVCPGVLIPRPESEHLVEAVLRVVQEAPYQDADTELEIVEFGLGSGAVLLSLLWELQNNRDNRHNTHNEHNRDNGHNRDNTHNRDNEHNRPYPHNSGRRVLGLGIDKAPQAIEVAQKNAVQILAPDLSKDLSKDSAKDSLQDLSPDLSKDLSQDSIKDSSQSDAQIRFQTLEADWQSPQVQARLATRRATGVQKTRRVVIANPPYLTRAEWQQVAPEVRYEPSSALEAGADGLTAYRALVRPMAEALTAGEVAVLEITPLRVGAITACFTEGKAAAFACQGVERDLAGGVRILRLVRL